MRIQADAAASAERGDAKPTSASQKQPVAAAAAPAAVPADETDDELAGRQRRHSMGQSDRRGSRRGSGGTDAAKPGLHKSTSTQSMYRRTGSTPTTSRPYDWRPTRSYVSFTGGAGGGLPRGSSGKSLTSVRTRQTIISRKDYHEDLKPTIAAVRSCSAYSVTCHID